MPIYKFRILTHVEAATRGILEYDKLGPVIVGDGSDDFVCGKCGEVIAKAVTADYLKRAGNPAFKCFNCKSITGL